MKPTFLPLSFGPAAVRAAVRAAVPAAVPAAVLAAVPAAVLAAVLACVLALPAHAQQGTCGPRALIVERLATGYGESRQSIGLAPNNTVVETFASAETGSWTITVTNAAGMTCLVAAGQAYEYLAEGGANTDPGA